MNRDRKIVMSLHEHLWSLVEQLPEDYEPYGKEEDRKGDCSCGCKWAAWLEDEPTDWLVCLNPLSHRAGKLTFEHQGCHCFQSEDEGS